MRCTITDVKNLVGLAALIASGCAHHSRPDVMRGVSPSLAAELRADLLAVNTQHPAHETWELDAVVTIDGLVLERYRVDTGPTLILGIDTWPRAATFRTSIASGTRGKTPEHIGVGDIAFQLLRSHPGDAGLLELEQLGARVQSALHPDWTAFWVTVPRIDGAPDPIVQVVKHEAARLRSVRETAFTAARTSATAALRRSRRGTVRARMEEALFGNLFAPDSPGSAYGVPALARQIAIGQLDPTSTVAALKVMYGVDRAVLVAVGDVDRRSALTQVRRHFGGKGGRRGPKAGAQPAADDAQSAAPQTSDTSSVGADSTTIELRLPVERPYVMLGWPLPPARHPEFPALEAAAIRLSRGPLRRLQEQGTVRSAQVRTVALAHGGAFEMVLGLNGSTTATTAAAEMIAMIDGLASRPMSPTEIAALRAELEARTWDALDTLEGRAARIAAAEQRDGGIESISERLAVIAALSPEGLRAAVKTHLSNQQHVIVICRPESDSAQ